MVYINECVNVGNTNPTFLVPHFFFIQKFGFSPLFFKRKCGVGPFLAHFKKQGIKKVYFSNEGLKADFCKKKK